MQQVKEPGLATFMQDYASYNLWANEQLALWLLTKPATVLDREVPSSFSSIRKTLLHIRDTERYWLSVLRPDTLVTPEEPEPLTMGALFDSIIRQSAEIVAFINTLDETAIKASCYLDSPWVQGTRPRFEFIQHMINHSTYHRGQVVTIGRNAGLTDAPMTDFNYYNFFGKTMPVAMAA